MFDWVLNATLTDEVAPEKKCLSIASGNRKISF